MPILPNTPEGMVGVFNTLIEGQPLPPHTLPTNPNINLAVSESVMPTTKIPLTECSLSDLYGHRVNSRYKPTAELVVPELSVGLEVEVEGWDGDPFVYAAASGKRMSSWQSTEDHSLKVKGREFTCGPICGDRLVNAVRQFCRNAHHREFKISTRTGIHVHLDCTQKSPKFIGHFTAAYMLVEHLLYGFCGQWRRWCGFCHTYYDATHQLSSLREALTTTKEDVFKARINALGRYSGLNLLSISKFGTVELRMLPTTFDAETILFWINCCQSIYNFAEWLEESEKSVVSVFKDTGNPISVIEKIFSWPSIFNKLIPHFDRRLFQTALFQTSRIFEEAKINPPPEAKELPEAAPTNVNLSILTMTVADVDKLKYSLPRALQLFISNFNKDSQ